jgi:hypothetical protein
LSRPHWPARRADGECLLLGHADGDGLELGHPPAAAELLPAGADPADVLGGVARSHGAQLDTRAERLVEPAVELAKVEPIVRREVDGQLATVEPKAGAAELDGHAEYPGLRFGEDERLGLAKEALLALRDVLRRGKAKGGPYRQHLVSMDERIGRERDGAEIRPNGGVHDHLISHGDLQAAWVVIGGRIRVAEPYADHALRTCCGGHGTLLPVPPVPTHIQHRGPL